jgi:hypothetical protein
MQMFSTDTEDNVDNVDRMQDLMIRIAARPLSSEHLASTWNPPEWEQIIEWWDQAVTDARAITGLKYR